MRTTSLSAVAVALAAVLLGACSKNDSNTIEGAAAQTSSETSLDGGGSASEGQNQIASTDPDPQNSSEPPPANEYSPGIYIFRRAGGPRFAEDCAQGRTTSEGYPVRQVPVRCLGEAQLKEFCDREDLALYRASNMWELFRIGASSSLKRADHALLKSGAYRWTTRWAANDRSPGTSCHVKVLIDGIHEGTSYENILYFVASEFRVLEDNSVVVSGVCAEVGAEWSCPSGIRE